jgi:hypothetical protein
MCPAGRKHDVGIAGAQTKIARYGDVGWVENLIFDGEATGYPTWSPAYDSAFVMRDCCR